MALGAGKERVRKSLELSGHKIEHVNGVKRHSVVVIVHTSRKAGPGADIC